MQFLLILLDTSNKQHKNVWKKKRERKQTRQGRSAESFLQDLNQIPKNYQASAASIYGNLVILLSNKPSKW